MKYAAKERIVEAFRIGIDNIPVIYAQLSVLTSRFG